jgi:hypothetical protein
MKTKSALFTAPLVLLVLRLEYLLQLLGWSRR